MALGALQLLAHVVLASRDRKACVWRGRVAARSPCSTRASSRRDSKRIHSDGRRGSSSAVAERVVVHVVLITLAGVVVVVGGARARITCRGLAAPVVVVVIVIAAVVEKLSLFSGERKTKV